MIWFVKFPLEIAAMVLCWLTNWLAILFADEDGEIHGLFKYWQTWDDSLDSKFMMTEVVPEKYKFLDYGWSDHYVFWQDKETLACYGHKIDKARCVKPLSRKERIQRYFCRLLWIFRNCAYGFAFWPLGNTGRIEDLVFVKNTEDTQILYDKGKSWLTRPWCIRFVKRITPSFRIEGYIGWKIPFWHDSGQYRCMVVGRIVPRFGTED